MSSKWFLFGWFAASAIIIVLQIGKPRKPVTPAGAAGALVVFAVLGALAVMA